MQMKYANRDELAWEQGELAYTTGDTADMAIKKAMSAGFRPGSNGYAAFITAFSRQVRSQGLRLQAGQRSDQGIALNIPAPGLGVGQNTDSL